MGITIFHQTDVAPSDFGEIHSALTTFEPEVGIVLSPVDGHQNSMEWALPVALAIVVSAPAVKFMEGFFGAAGEDAYNAVKRGLVNSFSKAKSKSLTWSKAGEASIKPPPMKVIFRFANGSIEFVFPDEASEQDIANATDKMNALLPRLADTLIWYERQFNLLSDNFEILYGPGFPIDEQRMHQIHFQHQLALGMWVFVPSAGDWIKAH